jgi:hypothetical protein
MDLELPEPTSGDDTARKWAALAPFLTTITFPELQSLDIWLDHDSAPTWTLISERVLLQSLPIDPSISTTVTLPYLHPKHESAARHFTPASPTPAFTLTRRVRQRLFAESVGGKTRVSYRPDFPLLLDHYEDMGIEVEDIVMEEREKWERGHNVEGEVRALSGMRVQYGPTSDSEMDLDNMSSDSDDGQEGNVREEEEEDDVDIGDGGEDGEGEEAGSDREQDNQRSDEEEKKADVIAKSEG